jgi:ribonucleoside-diphosphate reductase alpha chain
MDHPVLSDKESWEDRSLSTSLQELREHTVQTNKEWAEKLGINVSAAITTIKPSGTVSQLVDSASGIHPRHNPFYIRTVRADVKDPLAQFLKDKGVPCEPDVTNNSNLVFSFPIAAPKGSVTRNERTAIEALEHYLVFKRHWCEHNPSITVYVKEHEWLEVGAWVYKNLDDVGGVSFLPHSEHIYKQAPYQDITEEAYKKLVAEFPTIPWEEFPEYEKEDMTTSSHELSCTAGHCEII